MMTVTYLRRPLHLRLAWRLEAMYLRWRIRHADRCRAGHERDLRCLRESVDQMSRQIDFDEAFTRELVARLGKVVSK